VVGLAIRNLDRVVFPRTGTTKAELLDYYVRVAGVMLPHLRERQLHMHRYPEGVEGPRFWQKACPERRPEGISTVPVWSRGKHANIDYCALPIGNLVAITPPSGSGGGRGGGRRPGPPPASGW
jgi:bifunctional non-homologous end joining protein LigD